MKKLLLLALIISMNAYSDDDQSIPVAPIRSYNRPPVVPIVVDLQAQQMSRNDVILATQECESNGLRAVVVTGKRMVGGMMSDIIIDVQCLPKFRL